MNLKIATLLLPREILICKAETGNSDRAWSSPQQRKWSYESGDAKSSGVCRRKMERKACVDKEWLQFSEDSLKFSLKHVCKETNYLKTRETTNLPQSQEEAVIRAHKGLRTVTV